MLVAVIFPSSKADHKHLVSLGDRLKSHMLLSDPFDLPALPQETSALKSVSISVVVM